MQVWDTVTGLEVARLPGQTSVAFSPDGRSLATVGEDRQVTLWDVASRRLVRSFPGPLVRRADLRGVVASLAFRPDGQHLVAADSAGLVRVWNLATGREGTATRLGRTPDAAMPALSPDGQYLARGDEKRRTFEIWQTASGQPLRTVPMSLGALPAFGPASRLYAFPDGWTVKVQETASGRTLHTLLGHSDWVRCVAFSPDEQRLATCGDDTTVRLWDLHSGQLLRTLRGHATGVWSVAFSPDGRWLASTSIDGEVKLWDGRPLTADLRAEREARALLDRLYAEPGATADVPARLRADLTVPEAVRRHTLALAPLYAAARVSREAYRLVENLGQRPLLRAEILQELRRQSGGDEAVRQKALAYAEHYPDDPRRFNAASWQVVRQPHRDAAAYARALRLAEIACRLAPNNGPYLNTLGVAYYRTRQWRRAVETLKQSEPLDARLYRTSIPADLAFLALACHQLGEKDQAKAYFRRLRATGKDARWARDEEAQALLREAEAVLGATPMKKVGP